MKLKLLFFIGFALALSATTFGQKANPLTRSKTEPIKIGETAPDFTLTDQSGTEVTLSNAKTPVVLVFYRGYWCPYCVRQLAELRTLLDGDDKAVMYAISVDSADKLQSTRSKIAKDGKGEVKFSLLSDPGHKTIDAYGVFDPAYIGNKFEGIPHPAVFILDKKRKVMFAKVESDYKIRPTNQDIRAELEKLK